MHKHSIIKKFLKKDTSYTLQNNAICFLPGNHPPLNTAGDSLLGKIQDGLKRTGWLYFYLRKIFKPVWVNRKMSRKIKDALSRKSHESLILNLGSGPIVLKDHQTIINVDLYSFDEVDMVADAVNIPLQDDSADLILNLAMLEHVQQPEIVVNEMYRLLKSGGEAICYLPFIVPFHAAPHDYHRWTKAGVQHLFHEFDTVDVDIGAGPTSGLLWVMQEWLAILFSFGNRTLHDIIFLLLMILTSPIKILDSLMIELPNAEKIASGFFIIAKK